MRDISKPRLFCQGSRAVLTIEAGGEGGAGEGGGGGQGSGAEGGGAGDGGQGGAGQGEGQGGGDAPWFSKLPAELQTDRNITKYESLDAFAKAHQHALKRFGSKDPERMLEVPEKPYSEDPEAWKALHKALGAPETIEGYNIKLPETATDGDRAAFAKLAEAMLAAGATPAQFAPVMQVFGEVLDGYETARVEADNARIETSKAQISEYFGEKEKIYKPEIGGLIRDTFAKDKDPQEGIKALDEARWGESLPMMRVLAHAMDLMAEPGTLPGNGRGLTGSEVLTPYQAQGKLAEKMGDKEWKEALLDSANPRHKAVVAERNELNKMAHPARA